MKYCTHCGSSMPDDALYCPSCGSKIAEGTTSGAGGQRSGNEREGYDRCPPPYFTDAYSTLSVIGFVLSFLSSIAGLIVSIIAYSEAKRTFSSKSASFAKAGIIISSVKIALYVFFFVLIFIAALYSTPYYYY